MCRRSDDHPVGMAAVTPGADLDYTVDLDPDDRLTVEVDGDPSER